MGQTRWLLCLFLSGYSVKNPDSLILCSACLAWGAHCGSGLLQGLTHRAGCVLLVFWVYVLFMPSQELISEGSRKHHQADADKPSHLPGELTWAAEPLGYCEWLFGSSLLTPSLSPVRVCTSLQQFLTKNVSWSSSKSWCPHKDTPRLPHVPVIPLGFPPHVSVPWCSTLKAPAQANKPVPVGWLLIIRLTGGQVRIYTVILIQFYLWESIKTLQSSPQIEWYPDPK